MCGPVGGFLSGATKKTQLTHEQNAGIGAGAGLLSGIADPITSALGTGALFYGTSKLSGGRTGSLLDPLGLGPSFFDDPKVPKPKAPPPPVDETNILFKEMARVQTEQSLRQRRTSRKVGV